MAKRIIPVSSGKGGVGKTSFAINLALCLSQYGRTILVDLDTGTSSIRGTIDAPVSRDLYHFFKKGAPLQECITPLGSKLDPHDKFADFGFIASPRHMIEAITNMNRTWRNYLIDAINGLNADYIILDLKAGLDPGVIDFMPPANSGILVFTPNHPAATLAASDIAKAILFRELRELFHKDSPLYQHFKGIDAREINMLIDRTEDVYEDAPGNLDDFLQLLAQRMPGNSFVAILRHIVHRFRIYYVLNRFDGVETSYETAVKPLVENVTRHISSGLQISNLGWINESPGYHRANVDRIPYLLADKAEQPKPEKKPKMDEVSRQMEELYSLAGLRRKKEPASEPREIASPIPDRQVVLDGQLKSIEALFRAKGRDTIHQNFEYIVSCLRYVFQNKRATELGTARILKQGELVPLLLAQKMRRDAAMRAQ
ncbi:MAG: AAA family ATPase [Acidobacteriota bacterium]|nr:AAA family ATPase [Acidobacteriota bacterium]